MITFVVMYVGHSFEDLVKRFGIKDSQLNTEIGEYHCCDLGIHFDNVETYLGKLGLLPCQQTDVRGVAIRIDTATAVSRALNYWRQPDPSAATFRSLLKIILDLGRNEVAVRVCQYIIDNIPSSK